MSESIDNLLDKVNQLQAEIAAREKRETHRATVAYIMGAARRMTNDQRNNLFDALKDEFCFYCGCVQPKFGRCQCCNDE